MDACLEQIIMLEIITWKESLDSQHNSDLWQTQGLGATSSTTEVFKEPQILLLFVDVKLTLKYQ